jgi:hypothetical protein
MRDRNHKLIESNGVLKDLPFTLTVAMVTIAAFFALHPSVVSFLSERFLGGSYGDAGLYVWLVQSFVKNPLTALRFETNAFYPYPLTRAWSDSFLLPSALVYALMTWAGVSLTAAYNIVLTSALGMNAAASYGLAQRVGVSAPYAAAVGILFAN